MNSDSLKGPEWYDLRDPASPELDRLAERYHLHPLHIEDCRHRGERAKVEEGDGYMFVVLKPIVLDQDGAVNPCDLDIFVGSEFVITVSETSAPDLDKLLDSVHAANVVRPDQILYRIIDGVVDSYLPLLDGYDDRIDELQDQVLHNPLPAELAKLFEIKRALVDVRRVLTNTRDVAMHLQRTETNLIGKDLWPFFRDVYDHVARNLDLVETQRDLLAGALDVYLSSVANRTNQIMKVLTVLGTATLPAVVITSYYGMNVKGVPWADAPNGAMLVTVVIIITTAALLLLLRWFKWF
jgi:magnesium transporter